MSDPATPDALESHLDHIDGTEFTGDTTDIDIVDDTVADASLVGLGEAGHGIREFCTLKHRLFAHLVAEHGCRAFAMEANIAEPRAVDEYIRTGEGDPTDALRDIAFWVWQTESILALVEWMRAFNRGRPPADKIRFYGFDVQSTKAPATALESFLEQADPGFLDEIADEFAVASEGINPAYRPDEDEASDETIRERIETVESVASVVSERLDERRDAYIEATDQRTYNRAVRHCRVVEQAAELNRVALDEGQGIEYGWRRDSYMAENVAWIRDRTPDGPVALWAADGHLRKGNAHHEDPPDGGPMGYHLDQRYGDDYCAFALQYASGTVRTLDTSGETPAFPALAVASPPAEMLQATLDDQTDGPAYLDLAGLADEAPAWLTDRQMQLAGPIYDPDLETGFETEYTVDFSWEFDGLFFVPEVTAARLLSHVTQSDGD